MASRRGMAIRIEQADNRINAALARLTTGQDVPSAPEPARDPILRQTLRLEWIATALEAIDAAPSDTEESEPSLLDLTRPELNAMAAELGIEKPDKIKGGKPAVLEAIEAAQAALNDATTETDESDEEDDTGNDGASEDNDSSGTGESA